MDIFKQNRFLGTVIVLLVVLNLVSLAMLWTGRPQRPGPRRPEPAGQGREEDQLQRVLRDELDFDDAQIDEYRRLTRQHREEVRRLNDEIRRTKQRMFEAALQAGPEAELSASLLALAQQKQAEIEKSTFQYFLDLKKLCRPEQQDKLKVLVDELFRRQPGGQGEARPRPPADRPPPPPDRPADKH